MEKESYQMKLEFHHINYVSEDVDRLHRFYTEVLGMTDIPAEHFPRPKATGAGGYSGKIKFATDGAMQMHLAQKRPERRFQKQGRYKSGEKGHIAFRTDDIDQLKEILTANKIPYSDYGTAFAKEWHQVFFHDPEGNVIEVHQAVEPKE